MEEDNMITLTLGDWLYNSGLVGFIKILEYAKEEVIYKEQEILFNVKALDNFEEKYFNYFINKYEKKLSWSKIVSFKESIDNWEQENFNNFNEISLNNLNDKIDFFKKVIKSNSHVAAYELITEKKRYFKIRKAVKKNKTKKERKNSR